MRHLPFATIAFPVILISLVASSLPAHAGVIQLASRADLGRHTVTVFHTSTDDLLPSPHVVTTSNNTLSFTLAVGDWRRLDEGVNVLSDFSRGTQLLYTNNNNGFDLHGHGSIGGGGSGPAEITFAEAVRGVGFNAEGEVLGFETLTFSAFNDLALLGTLSVSRVNGQHEDDRASFLGVWATDTEVITRLVVSSVVMQGGGAHPDRFFFGPVTYRPVPEPSTTALLCLAVLCVLRKVRYTA